MTAEHDPLRDALAAHLDAQMPSRAELDADLERVLARRRRRRRTALALGVPGALAAAAAVAFVLLRAPAPHHRSGALVDEVELSVGDPANPASLIYVDLRVPRSSPHHPGE